MRLGVGRGGRATLRSLYDAMSVCAIDSDGWELSHLQWIECLPHSLSPKRTYGSSLGSTRLIAFKFDERILREGSMRLLIGVGEKVSKAGWLSVWQRQAISLSNFFVEPAGRKGSWRS